MTFPWLYHEWWTKVSNRILLHPPTLFSRHIDINNSKLKSSVFNRIENCSCEVDSKTLNNSNQETESCQELQFNIVKYWFSCVTRMDLHQHLCSWLDYFHGAENTKVGYEINQNIWCGGNVVMCRIADIIVGLIVLCSMFCLLFGVILMKHLLIRVFMILYTSVILLYWCWYLFIFITSSHLHNIMDSSVLRHVFLSSVPVILSLLLMIPIIMFYKTLSRARDGDTMMRVSEWDAGLFYDS